MTLHALLVFVHLTGAVSLFLAFGLEWAAISFLRTSGTPQEAETWLRLGRLAPLINGPALGVVILSGGYLASITGAMRQGWIPASLVGIVMIGLLGGIINVPKMRAIRLAIPAGGAKLSTALQNRLLPISVRLRTFLALGIVFMMITKQPFAECLLVLLGGLVLGLLLGIPALAQKAA